MTTPKWTEIALKVGDFEARIARAEMIERQVAGLRQENDQLKSRAQGLAAELLTARTELVRTQQSVANLTAEREAAVEQLRTLSTSLKSSTQTSTTDTSTTDSIQFQLDDVIQDLGTKLKQ